MRVVAIFLSDETTTRRLTLAFRDRCRVEAFHDLKRAHELLSSGRVLTTVVDLRRRHGISETDAIELIAQIRALWPMIPVVAHVNFTPQSARSIMAAAHAGAAEIILSEFDDLEVVANRIADAGVISEVIERVKSEITRRVPPPLHGFILACIKHVQNRRGLAGIVTRLRLNRKRLAQRTAAAHLPKPVQLMNWMRLLVATRMLDEGTRSTEKVARELGFSSGSALRNMLHRYVGCGPETLRTLGGFEYAIEQFVHVLRQAKRSRQRATIAGRE